MSDSNNINYSEVYQTTAVASVKGVAEFIYTGILTKPIVLFETVILIILMLIARASRKK